MLSLFHASTAHCVVGQKCVNEAVLEMHIRLELEVYG